MPLDTLLGAIGVGVASLIFLTVFLLGAIELAGKLYGSYRCLLRDELTTEQRIIYLLLVWLIPLGWLVYFLLGTERTRELFSDVKFL